jgi:mono/diheme cytochrome c family protein
MKSKTAIVLAATIGTCAWGATAAEQAAIERGNAHYLLFCANCHGVDADGQGPLARVLKITPTDLRHLRAGGGDELVAERVLKAVDQRHEVPSPEGPRMPLFSDNLEVKTIIEIGEYLKTVQR